MYSSLWYLLIGFLFGNGMPHFLWGSAGKVFRTPFGKKSSPRVNVGWGLFNFVFATALVWWRLLVQPLNSSDFIFFLVGFWFVVIVFGTYLTRLKDDTVDV